jgi:NADPH-dependent curcumin reductase CurA
VGSAGSDDKVAWLRDELRLDAAFNYRTATSVGAALAQHCPEGIDIDFENVGGATLQAVLDRAGRIKYRETIVEGIDQMPRALVGLFRGENFGKLLARVGDEPR